MNLTGKHGIQLQIIAMRMIRQLETWIPRGDSIAFRCESAKPDKQFRAWQKWFSKKENKQWEIDEEHKAFFFYRNRELK